MSADRPCTCYEGCDPSADDGPHQHVDDPCKAHPRRPILPHPTPPDDRALRVGDKLWMFDANRRRYKLCANGPIWREHWVERQIIGETRVSWLVDYPGETKPGVLTHKLPKSAFLRGGRPSLWARSLRQIEQAEWLHDHHYNLGLAVGRCNDYAILREVARLIGYDEKAGR
jgi:hypothetical protein